MKELTVTRMPALARSFTAPEAARLLEAQAPIHPLDTVNWDSFAHRPDVSFRIGHSIDRILLCFYVSGDRPRARIAEVNGPVYRDSCVEFFFSPLADGVYYNFEFNCAGVPYCAYGRKRGDRTLLDPALVDTIARSSSLGSAPLDESARISSWGLAVCIPIGIFRDCGLKGFGGLTARGNFYKCGDDTALPHYLSWNPVCTPRPDFHRYDYFGSLVFE